MGQATVDLPDPLNPPTAAPNISAADDLLSQLAGDEIDRLLADADGGPAMPPPSAPPALDKRPGPAAVDPTAAIDELFAELQAAPVGAAKPAPVEAPATVVAESAPPSPVAEAPAEPIVDEFGPAIAADERAALEQDALDEDSLAGDPLAQLHGVERELPIVLKPLAWISAPLDRYPEEVRETLGKIAILTIVDALAVLAYVMMFRHH